MDVEIVFCLPMMGHAYEHYCERFLTSYLENPPGIPHKTTIVCNGGAPDVETKGLFDVLPNIRFLTHDNSGFDIGAYQAASRLSTAEMIVFFGTSTYFKGPGWLLRMAAAFSRHGNAQYGVMGNQGDALVNVKPHIRTTAFWMAPKMMNQYPLRVTQAGQRYEAEHGQNCISEWFRKQGLQNWIVTWDGSYPLMECDSIPNGFHRGNQSALLAGDRISSPPYYHTA